MTALISKLKLQPFLSTSAWPNYGLDVLNITMHTEVVIHSMTPKQCPTPYGFRDIAQTRFYRSRSLWQGQIKVRQ